MRSGANDVDDRHLEAPRQLTGDAVTHRAARFGTFDRCDRNADVASPAVVGEILLAQESALAQAAQRGPVQEHAPALQVCAVRDACGRCDVVGWRVRGRGIARRVRIVVVSTVVDLSPAVGGQV